MKVELHASEFVTKTLKARSVDSLDEAIGKWQDDNPDAFVIGMEFSSYHSRSFGDTFSVLITYMVGDS